jgi:hypothetical protein
MDNQALTMAQAASICGMGYETFRYWVKQDVVPGVTMFGKRRQFSGDALVGWKPNKKVTGRKRKIHD